MVKRGDIQSEPVRSLGLGWGGHRACSERAGLGGRRNIIRAYSEGAGMGTQSESPLRGKMVPGLKET